MPTVRRRQRLSSSCTAPAERSPAISSRAMSFLISTGRLISASVSRSSSLKAKRVSPSGRPLRSSARMTPSSVPPVEARSTFTDQRARGVVGGGQRMRGRQAAGDDGDGAAFGGARQARDEFRAAAEIGAVGEPDHLHVGAGGEQARNGRQRVGALDRVRHRLELLEADARGGRRLQRDIAAGFAERDDGDAAIVGLGARDDVVGGAKPRVPACRRAKAVVDQERDRRRSGRGRDRRIPQRTRGGEDDERREREPQQCQPPRRARRRVFLRLDVEQQPRRRKLDRAAAAAE